MNSPDARAAGAADRAGVAPSSLPVVENPKAETAAAAISILQAQLELVSSSADSLDTKATFLPPVIVALAGILLPTTQVNPIQVALALAAVITGIMAFVRVIRQIRPADVKYGAKADQVAAAVGVETPAFNEAIARALAVAIDFWSARTIDKGTQLRLSMWWAGWTILFLVFTRLAGALG